MTNDGSDDASDFYRQHVTTLRTTHSITAAGSECLLGIELGRKDRRDKEATRLGGFFV
jgi:hypothetical protein